MDQYNLPGLLEANPDPSFWKDLLSKLQLSANVQHEGSGGSDVVFGSGRIGYPFQLDSGNLNIGLLGGGMKYSAATPYGQVKGSDIGLRGIDAAYESGLNTIGGSYQARPPSMGDLINLFYQRRF